MDKKFGYYKIPDDVKNKWVIALTSGEYKQSQKKSYFRINDEYTAIGVLCDLYLKEHNKNWLRLGEDDGDVFYAIIGESDGFDLTRNILNWAKIGMDTASQLEEQNSKENFKEIAEFIKSNY